MNVLPLFVLATHGWGFRVRSGLHLSRLDERLGNRLLMIAEIDLYLKRGQDASH